MTDLKDFYQQQFHKLEKVSDILSEVIIEFQKRIDGYPKTYNLLSSIDGIKFKEVQDLESFRQNLSFSSDVIEFKIMADMVNNRLVKQNSYILPPPQPESKN